MASNGEGVQQASAIICWKTGRLSSVAEAPGSTYSTATAWPCRVAHSRICRTWSGMERSFSACLTVDTLAYKPTFTALLLSGLGQSLHEAQQLRQLGLDQGHLCIRHPLFVLEKAFQYDFDPAGFFSHSWRTALLA
jgi:hypothetical protein